MLHSNIVGDMRATLLNLRYLGVNVIKEKGNVSPNALARIKRDHTKYYSQSRWVPLLQDILEHTMDDKLDINYCACTRPPVSNDSKSSGGSAGSKATAGDVRSARGWVWQRGGAPSGQTGGAGATPGAVSPMDKATIVVFIMGGVTYAELRLIYELMNPKIEENRKWADNYNIVIGSTDLITPAKFFSLVGKLPPIVS